MSRKKDAILAELEERVTVTRAMRSMKEERHRAVMQPLIAEEAAAVEALEDHRALLVWRKLSDDARRGLRLDDPSWEAFGPTPKARNAVEKHLKRLWILQWPVWTSYGQRVRRVGMAEEAKRTNETR